MGSAGSRAAMMSANVSYLWGFGDVTSSGSSAMAVGTGRADSRSITHGTELTSPAGESLTIMEMKRLKPSSGSCKCRV